MTAALPQAKWFTTRDGMPLGLWPVEWLALAYSALTTAFLFVLWPRMNLPWDMLAGRLCILGLTLLLWRMYRLRPVRILTFVRITAQMVLLCYWYPDTYDFNCTLPNLDHVFARWDYVLFGCQPALEFSRLCPWKWFSEILYMGYFSYYPMILVVMMFYFVCRNGRYVQASFIVMCSFFIYYLIYIWLPVTGPQFYFWAIPSSAIESGCFPALGSYFNGHTEMMPAPGDAGGLFYKLVCHAQEIGERPTAAFPSSHIAITLILLYLVYPQSRRLFYALLPFAVLLTLSTVYIQAHYLVDSIAGIITSYPVFCLSQWIYGRTVRQPCSLAKA